MRTRRGTHYYFAIPAGRPIRETCPLPKVDLLADGHYAVAPTSDGKRWYDGLSLDDLPLAPCPDWLLELVATPAKIAAPTMTPTRSITPSPLSMIHREKYNTSLCVSSACITKEGLQDWDRRFEVVQALGIRLGFPTDAYGALEKAFYCVLPGHDDSTQKGPSAAWHRQLDGTIGYHDFHAEDNCFWYSISEVYYACTHGHTMKLPALWQAIWHTRLLVDLGFIAPERVEHVPLPPDGFTDADHRLYAGFILLLGCRWSHNPGAPSPYTRDFAASWTGLGEATVTRSLKRLCGAGFMIKAGEDRSHGYPRFLFLPGMPKW